MNTQRFAGDDGGRVRALQAVRVDMVRTDGRLDFVPIPRSVNPARIAENVAIFDFTLSDDEMARISALKRPGSRIANPAARAPVWDA